MTPGAKTIKKNTNSTQNKFHRAKQYEVTSFLSTDCELSIETCSKNVYSLGPWISHAIIAASAVFGALDADSKQPAIESTYCHFTPMTV